MVRGTSILETEMKQLCLIMHVGTLTMESNTKFLFIPSMSRTKAIVQKYIDEHALPQQHTENIAAYKEGNQKKKKTQISEDKQHNILEKFYLHLPETRAFDTTSSGRITPRKTFVYLGSAMHFSLKDNMILRSE